jgi:outer membrane protein assembly factor BamE (lipoprotein component of BamABCDE complex)
MRIRRALIATAVISAPPCLGLQSDPAQSRLPLCRRRSAELTPGEDTRASVLRTLGNPSTRGTFETDTWYYISATREYLAYLRPDTRERRIIAVRFDEDGVVEAVDEYGMEDGRVVALVDRETPTRGRELTILEQLLGNVGRLPTDQFGGEQNLPGGAGGPRPGG